MIIVLPESLADLSIANTIVHTDTTVHCRRTCSKVAKGSGRADTFLGGRSCRNSAAHEGPDKIQRQGEDNGGVVLATDLVKCLQISQLQGSDCG